MVCNISRYLFFPRWLKYYLHECSIQPLHFPLLHEDFLHIQPAVLPPPRLDVLLPEGGKVLGDLVRRDFFETKDEDARNNDADDVEESEGEAD